MTVTHDWYLFRPDKLASEIRPYIYSGYETLQSAALALFDADANVRRMVSEYGGWDRSTLIAESSTPGEWLLMFLYAHLSAIGQISDCGNLPVHAKRDFQYFARQWLYTGDVPEYWNNFHPQSTLGHVSWFTHEDIEALQLPEMNDAVLDATRDNYCLCVIQSA